MYLLTVLEVGCPRSRLGSADGHKARRYFRPLAFAGRGVPSCASSYLCPSMSGVVWCLPTVPNPLFLYAQSDGSRAHFNGLLLMESPPQRSHRLRQSQFEVLRVRVLLSLNKQTARYFSSIIRDYNWGPVF